MDHVAGDAMAVALLMVVAWMAWRWLAMAVAAAMGGGEDDRGEGRGGPNDDVGPIAAVGEKEHTRKGVLSENSKNFCRAKFPGWFPR